MRVVRSLRMEGEYIGISLGGAGMCCSFGGRLNYAVSWQGGYMHVIGGILFWPSLIISHEVRVYRGTERDVCIAFFF